MADPYPNDKWQYHGYSCSLFLVCTKLIITVRLMMAIDRCEKLYFGMTFQKNMCFYVGRQDSLVLKYEYELNNLNFKI